VSARFAQDAVCLEVDATDRQAVRLMVDEAAARLGGLDVVIANAASSSYGPFRSVPPDDFDRTVASTFNSAVYTIRSSLPHLETSEGNLVVTGSVAGRLPLPLLSPYVAAKHALRGFVRTLQIELRGAGSPVSVSLVAPGPVDSPFWRHVKSTDGRMPPKLPLSYHPEVVAREILRCAVRPRREVTVGGAIALSSALHSITTPLADRIMARAGIWAWESGTDNESGSALWEPCGDAEETGGLGGRPSAVGTVRDLLT
jgi:NAD(P)-dependent dehydrogenase (short-subunit alcohol dehydrogenase family)